MYIKITYKVSKKIKCTYILFSFKYTENLCSYNDYYKYLIDGVQNGRKSPV